MRKHFLIVSIILFRSFCSRQKRFGYLDYLLLLQKLYHHSLSTSYKEKKQQVGEPLDEEALNILHTFGGNSDSQLIFLKTSACLFTKKLERFLLQFACYNNKCIVMGDPSGKK